MHIRLPKLGAFFGRMAGKLVRGFYLRRYDYPAETVAPESVSFAVIHIPDRIGDAMAVFPVMRSLERQKIKHLLVVASHFNRVVFESLVLDGVKITVVSMPHQNDARVSEVKETAQHIKDTYGSPDICVEAMRKNNLKTTVFLNKLSAKTNFQVKSSRLHCYAPVCVAVGRLYKENKTPLVSIWAALMADAGFPAVAAKLEFPISDAVVAEVNAHTTQFSGYIALNLDGSETDRTFSLAKSRDLILSIQQVCNLPIVMVYGPDGHNKSMRLAAEFEGVHCLSLSPSLWRSAAIVQQASLLVTPDTSVLHIAGVYDTPVLAIYRTFRPKWPPTSSKAEILVTKRSVNHLDMAAFRLALARLHGQLGPESGTRDHT